MKLERLLFIKFTQDFGNSYYKEVGSIVQRKY